MANISNLFVDRFGLVFSSPTGFPMRGLAIDRDARVDDWKFETTEPVFVNMIATDAETQIYMIGSPSNQWTIDVFSMLGEKLWTGMPRSDFNLGDITYYLGSDDVNHLQSAITTDELIMITLAAYSSDPNSESSSIAPDVYSLFYRLDGTPIEAELLTQSAFLDTAEYLMDEQGGAFRLLQYENSDGAATKIVVDRLRSDGVLIFNNQYPYDEFPNWAHVAARTTTNDGGLMVAVAEQGQDKQSLYVIDSMGNTNSFSARKYRDILKLSSDGNDGYYVFDAGGVLHRVNIEGNLDWNVSLSDGVDASLASPALEVDAAGNAYVYYWDLNEVDNEPVDVMARVNANGEIDWLLQGGFGQSIAIFDYVEGAGIYLAGVSALTLNGSPSQINLTISLFDAETGDYVWSYIRDSDELCGTADDEEKDEDSCGCGG